ncbi:MAG: cache domain-containing protein [Patescibacteria group bacterium]
MLEFRFLLLNAHFTLNLLAALVCFAVAWLYYDAWLIQKNAIEGTKSLGFLLLSISFVVASTIIEQSLLEQPLLGAETLGFIVSFAKTLGYLTLIVGQVINPIQELPSYRRKKSAAILVMPLVGFPLVQVVAFIHPILATLTAFLYLRRATVGLEHHLKPISWSFFILAIKEISSLASIFRTTTNIDLLKLVSPYGSVWVIENLLLAIAMLVLGKWVWGYLIKRLETQLFIIFTTSTLSVFLVTAIFFTSVSLANLKKDILHNLEISAKVLQYSIDSKKSEVLSDAQVISQNSDVVLAAKDQKRKQLADLTSSMLLTKKQSFLTVVDENGAVLIRADDPEKIGGSLSDDRLVKKALANEAVADLITKEGVMAPELSVRASAPIYDGDKLVGALVIGTRIDNAFVDGLKSATGLDASVYADNIRSATTFIAPDGKSRWVGIKEVSPQIQKDVLKEGKLYSGAASILNVPYLAAYMPLKDINNNPLGMLFVGRTQISTLQAASKLIEQTFIVTAILLTFSIVPAYFISRYIIDQI